MGEAKVLVPVGPSSTLRETVAYVVGASEERQYDEIHFVYVAPWRDGDPHVERLREDAVDLLDQTEVWAQYDFEDTGAEATDVVTAVVGAESYLFGPREYAQELVTYADERDIDEVVLDPEYSPVGNTSLLQRLEFELASTFLSVREAPVERPTRRKRLVAEATGVGFASVFGVSLLFYFLLGDVTYWFDWVTGVASAAIVAITLSQVSIDHEPSLTETPKRIVRGAVYVPVLLFEILKANVVVARVILSPKLPIDPTLNRVRVLVGSGLPLTTLANSITLTPGTLTVRARDDDVYVHSLIPWAREGLFEGSLERWVRFVFYGRKATGVPTPRERGDTAILQGPDAEEQLPIEEDEGPDDDADDEVTA